MKRALIDQLVDDYIAGEKNTLCNPSLTGQVMNRIQQHEENASVSPAWIKSMVTAGLITSILTAAVISNSYKNNADSIVLVNDDVTEHISWYSDESN